MHCDRIQPVAPWPRPVGRSLLGNSQAIYTEVKRPHRPGLSKAALSVGCASQTGSAPGSLWNAQPAGARVRALGEARQRGDRLALNEYVVIILHMVAWPKALALNDSGIQSTL